MRSSRQPTTNLYIFEARALILLVTNIEAAGAVDTMELRFHSSHSDYDYDYDGIEEKRRTNRRGIVP
jgi:hypothetical protein